MMRTKKCWEKNRCEKLRKKRFFMHKNMVTEKCWGKNARNNFSRNTPTERAKNVGKKIVEKSAKIFFLNLHEYRYQKRGKNARNIFPETLQ